MEGTVGEDWKVKRKFGEGKLAYSLTYGGM